MSCDICKHLNLTTSASLLKKLKSPKGVDLELLKARSCCESISQVCIKHYRQYVALYSTNQKYCCDPLSQHLKQNIKTNLREITLALINKLNKKEVDLIPGKKLCTRCRIEIAKLPKTETLADDEENNEITPMEISSNIALEKFIDKSVKALKLSKKSKDKKRSTLTGRIEKHKKKQGKLKTKKRFKIYSSK